MVYIRKVRTGSGAIAVQLGEKKHGRFQMIEHLGSAHGDFELGLLMEAAREKLRAGQEVLDLGIADLVPREDVPARPAGGQESLFASDSASDEGPVDRPVVLGTTSELLYEMLQCAYQRLGFDVVDDTVFEQLVLARIVEPTSKRDAPRVLEALGQAAPHRATIHRHLQRAWTQDYRAQIATACFEYASTSGDISLILYDVTTLYFEAEKEDDLRKVGYSKERRVDPQIVVGLLVDRQGFPLEIGCFEGNKAETATLLPVIRQFQDRHSLADMVIVADAGMLSATNLRELDEAGLRFIVGSRQTKAPNDLANHFHWHGDAFDDGQIIDTITPRHGNSKSRGVAVRAEPVWDHVQHGDAWRAIWAYSRKRAVRDMQTLTLQENRARAVIDGDKPVKSTRFVKTTAAGRSLDEKSLKRAWSLVGLKGYVTNIPASIMPSAEVIGSYHDLWRVEQSFRMSKTDLQARPMFHRTRDAIEAHLTIVFAALAVSRYVQTATGLSIKKIIQTLRPLQSAAVQVNGKTRTIPPAIPDEAQQIIDAITAKPGH
ncbi:MAG TPA: IS1634 family transposase [Arthrobacter sp.]|nr:IS1634 family transposase [Arthrobacter sp.]